MFIRPITSQDLPILERMAQESGPGFTSLAGDRDALARRIARSEASFRRPVSSPGDEGYLFVLEDHQTGDIMGVTGIEAAVGRQQPLYHFQRQPALADRPGLRQEVLTASRAYTGCSEICTLFLRPQFRRQNAGKLLSRVRFLFMAQHPQRFAERVIAEMRGVNEAGRSPFWDWLRPRFIDLDFETVTRRMGAGDCRFVTEHLPTGPLPIRSMPASARAVIGQVHPRTRPALRLLEDENFRHTGFVDLFDAGPTVEARLAQIRSVAESTPCWVRTSSAGRPGLARIGQTPSPTLYAVCNSRCDGFRALVTDEATYLPGANLLQLPQALADRLQVEDGGTARVVPLAATRQAPWQPQRLHPNDQAEEVRHAFR
ncbi:MAG: arginine N-succinyltransferase [Marinobacter sp.]|uniref:arginine N-succinyltransferase n=1 Tax=Marinobacter sp. TaxID=50741 RepID=UPI00299CD883|nr:arginine N-succinyltransferase [Marinobacter sp.]MDX1635973.1 arginine N-succinyltransferase [Marinobacter sp.]